jgi:HD-GYP domain-containing protein (c-di-GMP phosphodiesterase class II)
MTPIPESQADDKYFPINLQTLLLDSIRSFDIYIPMKGRKVLYHSGGDRFTVEVRNNLLANRITSLYIPKTDQEAYNRYIEENLKAILGNPALATNEKAEIAHNSITSLSKSLFENPRAQTITRYKSAISATMNFVMKDDTAITNLILLTSHDFCTYIHSVNVGIFATGLAKALLADDPSHNMNEIACGFFLHDIGKCYTPLDVLNKKGPLTEEEWMVIRRHPSDGYELLQKMDNLTEESRIIVMEHHERNDGRGYPRRLRGDQIHDYSKICCIADVFDALTAVRPYKGSKSLFQALKIMKEEMRHEFDPRFFEEFVLLFSGEKSREILTGAKPQGKNSNKKDGK